MEDIQKYTFDLAKKIFEEENEMKPNLNIDTHLLAVSGIQIGLIYAYEHKLFN